MPRIVYCPVCLLPDSECICDLECALCGLSISQHDDGECPPGAEAAREFLRRELED